MPKATLPGHLESYSRFIEHLDENMAAWQTVQKGDAFAAAALKLLTIDPSFAGFSNLRLNPKKSHDEGIDIFGATEQYDVALGCQSKFKIKTVEEFDSILSKFQAYDFKGKGEAPQFDFGEGDPTLYVIVTASRLENIREKYVNRNLASRQFYNRLVAAKRLEVIDGVRMLRVIQEAYTKQFEVPHQLKLQSTSGWINVDGAWLGFVSGDNLVQLHDSFGDGLFFENIRDFLGPKSGQKTPDDVTVNEAITRTIRQAPEKFVQRNNGLVIRADRVECQEGKDLQAFNASIINGCQTTMCLVLERDRAKSCLVPVKIVSTGDAWDVASSANFQNTVSKIDLDLARYLRPQLAKQHAVRIGVGIDDERDRSVVELLGVFYDRRVRYEELRRLFIGFVSRSPSNVDEVNYTHIRSDLLERFSDAGRREALLELLVDLIDCTNTGLQEIRAAHLEENAYLPLFNRVFDPTKANYRCLLALLALHTVLTDKFEEPSADAEKAIAHLTEFTMRARELLDKPAEFQLALEAAFQAFAVNAFTQGDNDNVIQQRMASVPKKFGQLHATAKTLLTSFRRARKQARAEPSPARVRPAV